MDKTEHTIKVGNLYFHKCTRCGHEWSSKDETPLRCAGCKTPYWNREKINNHHGE